MPKHTPLFVLGGSSRSYRVALPNGVAGYVAESETDPTSRAIDTVELAREVPVLEHRCPRALRKLRLGQRRNTSARMDPQGGSARGRHLPVAAAFPAFLLFSFGIIVGFFPRFLAGKPSNSCHRFPFAHPLSLSDQSEVDRRYDKCGHGVELDGGVFARCIYQRSQASR